MDKLLLIISILLLTHIAHCQDLTKPGDKTIRYELIKPHSAMYKLAFMDSSGKTINEFTARFTVGVNTEKGWVIVTQDHYLPDGRRLLDSTIADIHTLAPIRMRMVTTPHFMSMNLDFHTKDVHAVANKGGKLTDTLHTMEEGYFDSNLLEYLFGLLPYKKGFKTTINAYTFERNGMDPYKVEYVGEDVLPAPNGNGVWCYVAKTGNGSNAPDAMAWIEKATGKILKRIIPMGKNYYIITKI